MAKQKFGLGRGLDALISGASEARTAQPSSPLESNALLEVPIESIIPNPRQPRRVFREDDPRLLELCDSIKEHGLLQPLVVTRLDKPTSAKTPETTNGATTDDWFAPENQAAPQGQGPSMVGVPARGTPTMDAGSLSVDTPPWTATAVQYQLIAGERRWRAARLAGLTQVPVVVKEATPQQMLELALIENIQRADLNPIEEALAYATLVQEFGLTQEMVAKRVGKDRTTITNAIRLLQLAPKVRDALINQPETFSEGHARALVGIAREEDQITAMGKIISLRLNVRQAEELAARIKASEYMDKAPQESMIHPQGDTIHRAHTEDLENHFREALMVKVDLKYSPKSQSKGTIVLHFNSPDELERLYNQLVKRET